MSKAIKSCPKQTFDHKNGCEIFLDNHREKLADSWQLETGNIKSSTCYGYPVKPYERHENELDRKWKFHFLKTWCWNFFLGGMMWRAQHLYWRPRTKFIIFQLQLSQKQFSYCEQIPIPEDYLTFSSKELLHLSKHSQHFRKCKMSSKLGEFLFCPNYLFCWWILFQ